MAWNVMLGMCEEERDYLLGEGRCKKCGHFNALHTARKVMNMETFIEEWPHFCELPGCDCEVDVD